MANTNGNGDASHEIEIDPAVFQSLANLEKDFARVELDALRRKEFALKPLYAKRNTITSQIPNFWPAVLFNGPQEFQALITPSWASAVDAIKSLTIERYHITSETVGEPRSLRFIFEFNENELFEDTKVVKEFEFVQRDDDGAGDLVSNPVGFKWTKKGKKVSDGALDAVVELFRAEEAVRLKDGKSGEDLEVVDREGLWQYEKLREKLEKVSEEDGEASWLDWFGFRGAVGKKETNKNSLEDQEDDSDEEEEEEGPRLLDVEIFPGGEEVAIALAEDLWPNVMDYFMASQEESMSEDGDSDDFHDHANCSSVDEDEVPELVEAVQDVRPAKRQRKD